MAFVAGLLGLGAVGAAIFEIGAGFAINALAKKLAPKPKKTKQERRGVNVGLRVQTDAPRQFLAGECATDGSLVDWYLYGTNNERLMLIIALADHSCDSLQSVIVNDKPVTWNPVDGTVSEYPGLMTIKFYSGQAGQSAAPELVSTSAGRWTSDDIGESVCYVTVDLKYDENKFPGGIPSFRWVGRWALLYDQRKDSTAGGSGSHLWDDPTTWEWTKNPPVIGANIIRGVYCGDQLLVGLEAPEEAIRFSDFVAAANACDESVSKKGGGTEPRYEASGVWEARDPRSILEDLIEAMAGDIIEQGGLYRIMAGVAQSPVATLTDADLIVTEPLTTDPKRTRRDLVNAVFGTFSDPERNYALAPLPPRTSSSDEAADGGGRYALNLELASVTSRSQAQRIMEFRRKEARRQIGVQFTARARWFVLEVGDWITFTSSRRGYEARTFKIDEQQAKFALRAGLTLRETDAGIDDWVPNADELDDDAEADLPAAGPPLTSVAGLAASTVTVEGGPDTQRPGIRATWTPIDDRTVTELQFEFRKVGETVALATEPVLDPSFGEYTWASGVQGGVNYEIRAKPITVPARAVDWTAWVAVADPTAPQVVNAAALAEAVPPDTITPEMLSPQTRFELSLVTQLEAVTGSVSQRTMEAFTGAQLAAAAAVLGIDEADRAKFSLIDLSQQSGEMGARWGVGIVLDTGTPRVVGLVQLNGDATGTDFSVVADRFTVAQPGVSGGAPVTIFTIGSVDGVTQIAIDAAQVLIDGSVKVRHIDAATLSAISANIGEVTAGVIRSADGDMLIDLDNKIIKMVA